MRKNVKYSSTIDDIDLEILDILKENGRISLKDISSKIGKPISTVHERLKRLVSRGVIKNFTVTIDYEKLGYQIKALILINVDGKHIIEVEKHIATHPNVLAVYDITGEFDIAVLVVFKTISELDNFVKWLLQHPHIKQTRTSIVFRTIKEIIHPPIKA